MEQDPVNANMYVNYSTLVYVAHPELKDSAVLCSSVINDEAERLMEENKRTKSTCRGHKGV